MRKLFHSCTLLIFMSASTLYCAAETKIDSVKVTVKVRVVGSYVRKTFTSWQKIDSLNSYRLGDSITVIHFYHSKHQRNRWAIAPKGSKVPQNHLSWDAFVGRITKVE